MFGSWAEQKKDWYAEQRCKPEWQRKRLEVLARDGWRCTACLAAKSELHVHHCYYEKGAKPWEYPDEAFLTLCKPCHKIETEDREDAERDLSISIRCAGFSVEQLEELTRAFDNLAAPRGYRGFMAEALADLLQDANRLAGFVEDYAREAYPVPADYSSQTLDKP